MKRTIYMAVVAVIAALTITSCRWYNDDEMYPSQHPEKMFARIVMNRHDEYTSTILGIVLLDRYLSLEGNERDEFVREYCYRATVVFNIATGQYTVMQNGREELVAERIGEKYLFDGGEWRTKDGEVIRHIEDNKLWFSSGVPDDISPEPAYAQQIDCKFCDDDLVISDGKKRPYVSIAFGGSGKTSYKDRNNEFRIEYTFDKPLEFRHWFGYETYRTVVSGRATILVSDKNGYVNDRVTAVFSDNDITTEVKHLK